MDFYIVLCDYIILISPWMSLAALDEYAGTNVVFISVQWLSTSTASDL